MSDQNKAATASTAPASNSEIGQDTGGIQWVPAREGGNVIKLSELLDKNNWTVWKEHMKHTLHLCWIEEYAYGTVKHPDNAIQVNNWDFNDNYAQFIIINNIASIEMINISQCNTAHNMWLSLEAMHKTKGHQTIIGIIRNLFCAVADDDMNISEHLNNF